VEPLKFVFGYARKYKVALAATVVSMLLLVGVELLAPWIISRMVGVLTNTGLSAESLRTISRLAVLALVVYIARAGLQFTRSYMAHVAGWHVVADARRHIYEHLQGLSLNFYEDKQTGQLMSRMINDSDLFERLIAHAIPEVLVNVLSLIGVSVVLLSLNWQLMLLSLIPVPMIVFAMRGFAQYVRPAFRERQQELGELNGALNDNLSGIREIKAFTREDVEANHVGDHINRYRDSMLRALRLMATFRPFVEFSSSLGTVGLIYFGGRLALRQVLSLEDLVACARAQWGVGGLPGGARRGGTGGGLVR
jgi:ATP-binding cassette subfamily B protein